MTDISAEQIQLVGASIIGIWLLLVCIAGIYGTKVLKSPISSGTISIVSGTLGIILLLVIWT